MRIAAWLVSLSYRSSSIHTRLPVNGEGNFLSLRVGELGDKGRHRMKKLQEKREWKTDLRKPVTNMRLYTAVQFVVYGFHAFIQWVLYHSQKMTRKGVSICFWLKCAQHVARCGGVNHWITPLIVVFIACLRTCLTFTPSLLHFSMQVNVLHLVASHSTVYPTKSRSKTLMYQMYPLCSETWPDHGRLQLLLVSPQTLKCNFLLLTHSCKCQSWWEWEDFDTNDSAGAHLGAYDVHKKVFVVFNWFIVLLLVYVELVFGCSSSSDYIKL